MAARMLVSFGVIIFFLTFNVQGDEEAERYRCPGLGERCNHAFVNPCCGDDLECRKIHSSEFICRNKASSVKIHAPTQLNNTARSSIIGGLCRINEHCKPKNSVCISNTCQCSSSFTAGSDRTCVRKILGYPCIDGLCGEIPYAKCSDNICKCTANTVAINSLRCQPTINRTCATDFGCTVKNSHCIDHKCQCEPQYAPTANQQCLSTKLGEHCSEDEDCSLIRNAKCYKETCICKDNYVAVRNIRCIPSSNHFCSKNYPCVAENFHCIDHKCQCKPNFRLTSPTKCISVFDKLPCENNSDCAKLQNSVCIKKICNCQAHYVRTNQARCDPLLDKPCRKSIECATPNSVCVDNICQCALFYSQHGINHCLPGALRGSCGSDEDCKEIPNSRCVENKCQCRADFIEKNVLSCVKSLDGLCTQDRDCFGNTTLCIGNRCQCGQNYLPLSESQCRSAYVDKVCHDDHDCEKNSFCSNNGVCVCDYNYAPLNGVCAPLLNVSCSPNQHCAVENALCIDGKCQCISEYAPRSNYQCKISHLGKICKTDIDCNFIKNAKCSDETCQCRANHVQWSPSICRALNGEPCSTDRDCAVNNAVCIHNECICSRGFVTTRDYCEPPPFRQFCKDDDDCTQFNTMCSLDRQCVCKPNHPTINGTGCGSWLADRCFMDQDCLVEDSICINDKCQCKSHYVAESKFQCVPNILGGQCRNNGDCSAIFNSLCSDRKICACVKDSVAAGNLTCIPSVGKTCLSKKDCVSPFYDCIDNKCQCKANLVTVSDWQCVEKNSSFSCENDYDCGEPWHSKCLNSKKCICKLNSYATNMSTCRPLLGGYCWKDDQCLPANSECCNFQCKCKNRFVAVANNLCVLVRGS